MCLAVPGKIISFFNEDQTKMAKVSFNGIVKEICVEWLPDIDIGDFVLVHVGFAISKIDNTEAEETLKLIREINSFADDQEDNFFHEIH